MANTSSQLLCDSWSLGSELRQSNHSTLQAKTNPNTNGCSKVFYCSPYRGELWTEGRTETILNVVISQDPWHISSLLLCIHRPWWELQTGQTWLCALLQGKRRISPRSPSFKPHFPISNTTIVDLFKPRAFVTQKFQFQGLYMSWDWAQFF